MGSSIAAHDPIGHQNARCTLDDARTAVTTSSHCGSERFWRATKGGSVPSRPQETRCSRRERAICPPEGIGLGAHSPYRPVTLLAHQTYVVAKGEIADARARDRMAKRLAGNLYPAASTPVAGSRTSSHPPRSSTSRLAVTGEHRGPAGRMARRLTWQLSSSGRWCRAPAERPEVRWPRPNPPRRTKLLTRRIPDVVESRFADDEALGPMPEAERWRWGCGREVGRGGGPLRQLEY